MDNLLRELHPQTHMNLLNFTVKCPVNDYQFIQNRKHKMPDDNALTFLHLKILCKERNLPIPGRKSEFLGTLLLSFSKGCVQIHQVTGMAGIGGELDVPCTTNRLYGGPNASGRRKRPLGFHTRTLMSRPHMTRVPRTVPGGEQRLDNRGNRSGRERSSPTWGHECCGVTGWRKCVGLAEGYERPP